MSIFVGLLFIFCLVNAENCGPNEELSECVDICNTCQSRADTACNFLVCNEGCDCVSGTTRDEQQRCIPVNQCPPMIWLSLANCPPNEVEAECVDKCQTCEYKDGGCFATEECNPGCNCKENYFRNGKGTCVHKSKCAGNECKENEKIYSCKPTCKNTCKNYRRKGPCSLICISGCDCKPEYVRSDDGKCVKPEQCECPLINCLRGCRLKTNHKPCPICVCSNESKVCKKDEKYYNCTPSCKNNCKRYYNPGIRCGCGDPGCFCREGLVKNGDHDQCIPPEDCEEAKQQDEDLD